MRPVRHTPGRRLLAGLLALVAVAAAALPAWAHAELVSSEPAPGATVPHGLTELRLTFSEPLSPASQVLVYAGQFEAVSGVSSTVEGPVLHASLATPLGKGTYTVQWTAVGEDGHPVEGTYQFGVSAPVGDGLGPTIVFGSSLLFGTLAVVAIIVLARRKR